MKKFFFTVILFLLPTQAFADCGETTCVNVKITMLYVTSGITHLQTTGTETNLTNCTPEGGSLVSLSHSHGSADKIYAALLSAYVGKLNIRLRFNDTAGGTGACHIQYAVLEGN
jgi:hypothetical protein